MINHPVNFYQITFNACSCCYCGFVLKLGKMVLVKKNSVGSKLFLGGSAKLVQYQEPVRGKMLFLIILFSN